MSIFDIFKRKEEKAPPQSSVQPDAEIVKINDSTDDEDEIAAVISAVLSCMDEEETVAAIMAAIGCMLGKSTGEFIVRDIKRMPQLDPIWSQAGRMKLMR